MNGGYVKLSVYETYYCIMKNINFDEGKKVIDKRPTDFELRKKNVRI